MKEGELPQQSSSVVCLLNSVYAIAFIGFQSYSVFFVLSTCVTLHTYQVAKLHLASQCWQIITVQNYSDDFKIIFLLSVEPDHPQGSVGRSLRPSGCPATTSCSIPGDITFGQSCAPASHFTKQDVVVGSWWPIGWANGLASMCLIQSLIELIEQMLWLRLNLCLQKLRLVCAPAAFTFCPENLFTL